MMKASLAVIAAVSFIGLTEAFKFRYDKCGDAEVWFDGYYGRAQCEYIDKASESCLADRDLRHLREPKRHPVY
jgi:hypothetical protein